MSFCQSLEDVQIKYGPISILKDISKLSNLKFLQLDQIGRYDYSESEDQKSQMISNFFEAFDFDTMKGLALCEMDISLEHLTTLANRKCPKLDYLCLAGCRQLKIDEGILKRMISNSPQLKEIHTDDEGIDLTDEQLYQFMKHSGVKFRISTERIQQLEKFMRYKFLGCAKTYFKLIHCYMCGSLLYEFRNKNNS